jgi:NADP-reducing hydrogenase subunit HndB
MAIKSLDELKKIREASLKKVNLRETGEAVGEIPEILVGMATCGIAAGARETFAALLEAIEAEGLEVRLVQVGCLGYCHSEPTVQVNVPGSAPVLYGKVDAAIAKEIVKKHLKDGDMLQDNVLINTFAKA